MVKFLELSFDYCFLFALMSFAVIKLLHDFKLLKPVINVIKLIIVLIYYIFIEIKMKSGKVYDIMIKRYNK